jgi:enoyl-CoA hydratase/carnithine racemase
MNYSTIVTTINDRIGTITLNRPEHNNTFNKLLAKELNEALMAMETNEAVNVIVIDANGKNFCTGIDVNYVMEDHTNLDYRAWVQLMEQMNITIAEMGKPVITSVHNIAVANGIGLVAASDLCIAADNARFGATAINVGLFCMGPAVPLSRSLGRKKTLELILTGKIIDAKEAERIGLINKVVPGDQLKEATHQFASTLADKSPLALQIGKKSFYKMEDLNYRQALDLSNEHFANLCNTEDAKEGVEAFLNKREPHWKKK